MSLPRALSGEYANLIFVKTRSVAQMQIEFPIEEGAEIVKMFGAPLPGSPVKVAVARLKLGREVVPDIPQPDTKRASSKSWDELPLAQQAGIRCSEESFWKFLSDEHFFDENGQFDIITDAEKAAVYVRLICGVDSRADLDKSSRSRILWRGLDAKFQAWLADPVPAPEMVGA